MSNYLIRLTVLAIAIFLYSAIFPYSPLTSPYHSIVYAAVIQCDPGGSGLPPCYGTEGDDKMRGDAGNNVMSGLGGNDQLNGGPGDDILQGWYGNDQLNGGPGHDVLHGHFGTDFFNCGNGHDVIRDFSASQGDTSSNDCEVIYYWYP